MIRKVIRLATFGLVGCHLIVPFSGCDGMGTSQPKPTIDMSTPIKAPAAPTTQTVEPLPAKAKK
jgi:hypothetical protein